MKRRELTHEEAALLSDVALRLEKLIMAAEEAVGDCRVVEYLQLALEEIENMDPPAEFTPGDDDYLTHCKREGSKDKFL